jgi:PAS domain S-box-containing protein
VALVFVAVGSLWVVLTDLLVYRLLEDPLWFARFQTVKDWLFVGVVGVLLYMATHRMVRRLARSNATFRAVVSSISDGVLLLDRDGAISLANPAAAQILGTAQPSLVGVSGAEFARRFRVSLPNGLQLPPERFASQRALTGESPPPYKAVLHPPGKPEVIAIVTGAPVRPIPEGPVALAVSIMHDVTAVEKLQRMRDAFISSAAHTLKTPVAIIDAQSDQLASGLATSPAAASAAIKLQCGRIRRLIDNLVVLARLRSESLQLELEAVDFASVVIDAAHEMEEASPVHTLRATIRVDSMVFGDRDRLGLVVRNLIEVAYRRAVANTEVTLVLDATDGYGRVSVSYEPLAPFDVLSDVDAGASFTGLEIERYVNAELVKATNGHLGSVAGSDHHREDWIQIPTFEDHALA